MLLIPAIDIKDGKCVRLRQGRMEDDTVFSMSPVAAAKKWLEQGARRIHVVDLDGAFAGMPKNIDLIADIVQAAGDIPVQIGGGIRDEDTIAAYLDAGAQYVIVGSRAVREPHFIEEVAPGFPGHLIVGLDAKNGKVATDGWSKLSNHDVIDLAKQFEDQGVAAIIFTDISRDGMMQGLNIESTRELAEAISIPVIASGGVTNLDDIRRLMALDGTGVEGVVIGRALYENAFTLEEAQALVDQG
ncbi:MAG: 1-(5-phosphoribosyl)-5-[(5-phosphoribosylamino)methylideneamino]imidazole-4-carboxamide isomerase [Gammaproteobacteria bacterium]|nr:1-(5-phosphoribosyl)-5-[(5-phosphoribosylamino)methylideneamino]imidazole-4-carboxamide isomerase [Gammaproteobacteria bacterium]